MKITFYAKNIKLTYDLEDYARAKINALEHYFKRALEAKVELDYASGQRTGPVYRIEINIRAPKQILRAEHTSSDIHEAIDLVVPKLKKEIERYKEKMEKRTERKRSLSFRKMFGEERKGRSRF